MDLFARRNDEERLAQRLREGEVAALREFYARYAEYLTGICSRYITDRDDVKDVFQECMLKIATNIGRFEYRGNGSLRAWSTRIAVNQALKFLNARKRLEFSRLDYDIPDETEEEDPLVTDIPPELIHAMIRELPTGYRTVFNLFVFEEMSHREIASLLGIRPDTSASQLHKAKNLLAKKIKQYKTDLEKR